MLYELRLFELQAVSYVGQLVFMLIQLGAVQHLFRLIMIVLWSGKSRSSHNEADTDKTFASIIIHITPNHYVF